MEKILLICLLFTNLYAETLDESFYIDRNKTEVVNALHNLGRSDFLRGPFFLMVPLFNKKNTNDGCLVHDKLSFGKTATIRMRAIYIDQYQTKVEIIGHYFNQFISLGHQVATDIKGAVFNQFYD